MEKKLFTAFLVTRPQYLSDTSYQKDILDTLKSVSRSSTINQLFIDFFKKELEPLVDDMVWFDSENRDKKMRIFREKSTAHRVFCEILDSLNAREVQTFIKKIYTTFSPESQLAIIRTPRELSASSKANIRKHYKHDGVIFETQEELIGGMLVYRNETIIDHSFSSFLSRIYSLNS